MADEEEQPEEKPFSIERAKQGKAACKLCKQKCPKDELRIAKLMHNPFGAGKMKAWHHLDCLFAQFLKQRVATKRIDFVDDIDGFEQLNEEDQKTITEKINESRKNVEAKFKIKLDSPKKDVPPAKKISTQTSKQESNKTTELDNKDMQFKQFRRLVSEIANVSSYLDKTEIVSNFFKHGTDGKKFKGNITLWCKLLLPGVVKRVYNLQSKQIVKIMSKIFAANPGEMLEHLRQGDVADTVQEFFEKSDVVKPAKKASLSMTDVDQFLEELTTLTKEEDQINHFKKIIRKCTGNDLTMIIRLVKHDLRMNAGAKHILEGVHPDAYQAYQSSRDLDAIISRCLNLEQSKSDKNKTAVKATICVMTPVLPMLAEACKSVEQAMKKCPKGMYSEIKYDGERVQLHKEGSEFKYYSRSLKPVLPHKVEHFKKYIPQAFKHGKDLILDSEILLIDCKTSKPLPFGTLGKHKKNETSDANVCLFVFDCIYYNGEILTNKPLSYRKKILHENMTEIKNHIMFSEFQTISKPDDLSVMIAKVLKLGLEGLVLKPVESVYEPGKRHWLKVKKDYLFDGAMADSADLIVLGAWYGTGKKGGMMSVFLMGCYDKQRNKFCTVTKVHTGHDDKTLNKLQKELDMVNINCEPTNVPDWLHCTRTMVPDFVAKDPKKQPVWEITGAEFTKHDVHTASGISIRFPRVSKIRDDKDWETATSLEELQLLFKNSKESTDVSLLMKNLTDSSGSSSETINDKKRKNSSPEPDTNDSKKLKTVPESNEKEDLSTVASHEPKKQKIKSIEIKHPLPNFFSSTNILVDSKINDLHRDILRYFTAYGGSILNKNNSKEANFVVHLDDVVNARNFELMCPNWARHVTLDWLKDCTASEKILDFEPYCVKWDPNL